jgi:NADH-quinone oxidoreductase subunit L
MYVRRPELPGRIAAANRPLYDFLLNKWYFDEIYDAVFVRPAARSGGSSGGAATAPSSTAPSTACRWGSCPTFTRAVNRVQSGYVFHYAFGMVIGIAILLTWFTVTGGAE